MILDSSAAVAIILEEEKSGPLEDALLAADTLAIGAPTLLETGMVLIARDGDAGSLALSAFLTDNEVDVVPFDESHWTVAADAFARYGKGRHPARLNYGDCMTYATARLAYQPLLCVGDDFTKTDLRLAPV